MTFAMAAVARGEKAALFIFDEELGLLFDRMNGLGIELRGRARSRGDLIIEQIDAAELSPGEFAHRVRATVDTGKVKTVVIDSLNGYQAAMPEENSLILHIHELLQYLNRQGAATFMTVAQHGLVGEMQAPVDVTYLADTVILLRYFEAAGRVRRAISVIKKRTGTHESTIREFRIARDGLTLGEPLEAFHGVLRGVPTYAGDRAPLLHRTHAGQEHVTRREGHGFGTGDHPGAHRSRRPSGVADPGGVGPFGDHLRGPSGTRAGTRSRCRTGRHCRRGGPHR